MVTRRPRAALAGLLLVAGLAGCGSSSGGSAAAPASPPPPLVVTTPPVLQDVTVHTGQELVLRVHATAPSAVTAQVQNADRDTLQARGGDATDGFRFLALQAGDAEVTAQQAAACVASETACPHHVVLLADLRVHVTAD